MVSRLWVAKRNSRSVLKVLVLEYWTLSFSPIEAQRKNHTSISKQYSWQFPASAVTIHWEDNKIWLINYSSEMSIIVIQKTKFSTLAVIYKEPNCKTVFQLSLSANEIGNK